MLRTYELPNSSDGHPNYGTTQYSSQIFKSHANSSMDSALSSQPFVTPSPVHKDGHPMMLTPSLLKQGIISCSYMATETQTNANVMLSVHLHMIHLLPEQQQHHPQLLHFASIASTNTSPSLPTTTITCTSTYPLTIPSTYGPG